MEIKNVTYKELNNYCWTEDNRIQAMSDRRNGAWYNYDATGERNLKLTGQTYYVNQNGQDYYTPIFDQQTLYANPLITINDRGYTKHYFEEGRRICSKIGSGDLLDINTLVPHMETPYEEQQNIQREGLERTFITCMELTPEIATHNLYETVVQPYEGPINPDEPSFYYHSDHLGSASFLTDRDGYETQQLVYLPFGEDWVDMKYNTGQYDTPYKFNGKEKDEETGYNNFGARYYYDWATIWLSVDPMSDKYPHLTSYNYCANNPVMLIDPDGKAFGPKDRIAAAKLFIGDPYKQQTETKLRTGYSKSSMEYVDCSEMVCRVMDFDGITDGVVHKNTSGLKTFLGNEEKFEHSMDSPQPGDIALWKGHVGVVSEVDEEGNIKLIHAANPKRGTVEEKNFLSPDQISQEKFEGYYRPKNETPDGKVGNAKTKSLDEIEIIN